MLGQYSWLAFVQHEFIVGLFFLLIHNGHSVVLFYGYILWNSLCSVGERKVHVLWNPWRLSTSRFLVDRTRSSCRCQGLFFQISLYLCTCMCMYPYVLRKEMAPHSSVLARKTPWMVEVGGLHLSPGLQRAGYNLATEQQQSICR